MALAVKCQNKVKIRDQAIESVKTTSGNNAAGLNFSSTLLGAWKSTYPPLIKILLQVEFLGNAKTKSKQDEQILFLLGAIQKYSAKKVTVFWCLGFHPPTHTNISAKSKK